MSRLEGCRIIRKKTGDPKCVKLFIKPKLLFKKLTVVVEMCVKVYGYSFMFSAIFINTRSEKTRMDIQ